MSEPLTSADTTRRPSSEARPDALTKAASATDTTDPEDS